MSIFPPFPDPFSLAAFLLDFTYFITLKSQPDHFPAFNPLPAVTHVFTQRHVSHLPIIRRICFFLIIIFSLLPFAAFFPFFVYGNFLPPTFGMPITSFLRFFRPFVQYRPGMA